MIKDFISDALSNESVTAQDIASVIRDELNEWIKYHRLQMEKAEKVLGLLDPVHDMSKFDTKFDLFSGISNLPGGMSDDIYSLPTLSFDYTNGGKDHISF